MRRNGFSIWSVVMVLTAWAIIVLAVSFFYFISSIERQIEERAAASLCDVSRSIAQLLKTKVDGQWATLDPVSKYAGMEEDLLNSENLAQITQGMKGSSSFSAVFVTDRTGKIIRNDGAYIDISDRYYYKKALQGYHYLTQILQSRVDGEDVFVFSRPVYSGPEIRGTLNAAIRLEDFQRLIDLSVFDGMGYTYIISGNGDVLIESIVDDHPLRESNLLNFISRQETESSIDIASLKEDMRCRQSGFFTFVADENVHNAYYVPLGVNDWYVFCGVPQEYLKAQSSDLFWTALRLCLGVAVAFVPAILAVWFVGRAGKADLLNKNRELQWNEERFQIVSSLSNSIIFEADLESGTMIYLSGLHLRPEYESVREDFPFSLVKAGYIHPDDGEAFIRMHQDIPLFAKMLSGEFRIKGSGDEFVWHRIEEVLLSNEKGKAIRSIGRAMDISEEKKAIEQLREKSQIDGGSGLYNKNATERFIRKLIEESNQGLHAMIVVDIDEFKAINDSRGHLYGDMVIADLAAILKKQFRTTDILGRIGGDEFMLFLKDIPNEMFVASKVAKMRKAITETHDIGISAGIAVYPRDGATYEELYKHADAAMYSVKKSGKNSFEFFVNMIKDR